MKSRLTDAVLLARIAERGAWGLVIAGLLLAVAPARVPSSALVPATEASLAVVAPPPPAPAGRWLDANPFAVSRRAPARRWLASDTATEAASLPDAVVVPDVPRLFGTLVGSDGASALLRLDAANPAARLYMEGERGGAYRVRLILDDRVILDGPSGRIELRLRRGEARP